MYYIYKEWYNEEKNGLSIKYTKKFDYKKLRLTDDYEYKSEKEEKKQSDKKLDKKEPPKKLTKIDAKESNELINKEETIINRVLFQKHLIFQMPTPMLKVVYITNNRRKNEKLVNVVKNGLSDLKDEIKEMSENEIEKEKPYRIVNIVEKICEFNRQNQEGQGLKILSEIAGEMLGRLPDYFSTIKSRKWNEN